MAIAQISTLIAPCGGRLVNLTASADAAEALKARASHLPSIQITPQAACGLELLSTGAYSPLDRFMGREDYRRVLAEMRLAGGAFFPVPVTLTVEPSPDMHLDREIALRGSEFELLGVMTIEEIFPVDEEEERQIFGTAQHAGGARVNVSGSVKTFPMTAPYAFRELRLAPTQIRARLEAAGCVHVFALRPAEPGEISRSLMDAVTAAEGGALLAQIPGGPRKPGDFEAYNRVRAFQTQAARCGVPERVLLSLLPQARQAHGARETLRQALIARNHGANHLFVSPESTVVDAGELGITFVPLPERKLGEADSQITQPRLQQGACIWFTGLSGSGKSTTAEILSWMVMEHGRRVTVLDGDVVRTHLSKGLGFSKEDRDTNVRRIGFVASELVRIGGLVVCSVVSPYRAAREDVRGMVGSGSFVEVFVDTPLEVCEARDVKGMYARARSGALKGFTGIDDPYEPPEHPEITLDTVRCTPAENAARIVAYLMEQGFLQSENQANPSAGTL